MERWVGDGGQERLSKIDGIRQRILGLLEQRMGIVVEGNCWVYKDETTGARVKVSRPDEVLGVLKNSFGGCEMLILESADLTECGEGGLVLSVYNDRNRVWHKANLAVKRREVRLPISDLRYPPAWFDLNLDVEYNGSRFGDWQLVCPDWMEEDKQKKMLDFYMRAEILLGIRLPTINEWLKGIF